MELSDLLKHVGQTFDTLAIPYLITASPEDVILKKLEYYRLGGSEKHLRDIVGVLKVQGEKLDRNYIADWVKELDVESEWHLALSRLPPTAGS